MTPSKRSRLLELAERCERAREGSIEIDILIWQAIGCTGSEWPDYTSSVDCALTLAPKGWSIKAQLFDGHPVLGHTFDVGTHKGFHPTVPALALCAAALRALASQEPDDAASD